MSSNATLTGWFWPKIIYALYCSVTSLHHIHFTPDKNTIFQFIQISYYHTRKLIFCLFMRPLNSTTPALVFIKGYRYDITWVMVLQLLSDPWAVQQWYILQCVCVRQCSVEAAADQKAAPTTHCCSFHRYSLSCGSAPAHIYRNATSHSMTESANDPVRPP